MPGVCPGLYAPPGVTPGRGDALALTLQGQDETAQRLYLSVCYRTQAVLRLVGDRTQVSEALLRQAATWSLTDTGELAPGFGAEGDEYAT
ncbi:MAG: hypothetical protein KKA73_31260 [Chloroflexi bacterium]|nr:hypothetical protein [Chloroflexota bacterium]MBU1752181.1 hypothetical protein [Chloroflexota bacterium]